MKTNAVGWFEIYVADMARSKKFYESVFNVTLEKLGNAGDMSPGFEMWSFPNNMTTYGAGGALVKMPGFPVGRNSVLIYFSCEDCAQEEMRVREFGGKIEKSKFSIGQYGYIALGYDLDGNMFGLHSMK